MRGMSGIGPRGDWGVWVDGVLPLSRRVSRTFRESSRVNLWNRPSPSQSQTPGFPVGGRVVAPEGAFFVLVSGLHLHRQYGREREPVSLTVKGSVSSVPVETGDPGSLPMFLVPTRSSSLRQIGGLVSRGRFRDGAVVGSVAGWGPDGDPTQDWGPDGDPTQDRSRVSVVSSS